MKSFGPGMTNVVDNEGADLAALTAAVAVVDAETDKIDQAATDGLAGTADSLAYRTSVVERHLHGRERWFGKLAVQTATDWADDTLTPYRVISGAAVYGADANDEALVLGTDDTPAIAGNVRFDVHRFMVIAASSATPYKMRFVYGIGTMADAIAAGQYSEIVLMIDPAAAQVPHDVFEIMMPRLTAGTMQVWAQCRNATDDATIDFLVGLHEYE